MNQEESCKGFAVWYTLLSAAGFSYLVMPQRSGLGVLVFILLQSAAAIGLVLHRKLSRQALWTLLPLVVFGMNAMLRANGMWRVTNVWLSLLLCGVFALAAQREFRITRVGVWGDALASAVTPLSMMHLPFRWSLAAHNGKKKIVWRILLGLVIAVPFVMLLILLLSLADQMFSRMMGEVVKAIMRCLRASAIAKGIVGVAAGMYLGGVMALACTKPKKRIDLVERQHTTDGLIFAVVLSCLLAVYLLFVFVQFKYLFCGAALPEGFTYPNYARRGFFELFLLTGVNLALIVAGVRIFGGRSTFSCRWIQVCNLLLCGVTLVLLASSFYRMLLYSGDDGLTRMRLMVFGFLLFEAVGLAITVVYVIRPRYNILAVYITLGFLYYLVLNLANIDGMVARNQVNRYLRGDDGGIRYVMTLSADAAPEIARLLEPGAADMETQQKAQAYLKGQYERQQQIPQRWQRWSWSAMQVSRLHAAYIK